MIVLVMLAHHTSGSLAENNDPRKPSWWQRFRAWLAKILWRKP